MSSRRTLILVGAIVVAALAALLILRYVSSVEDKATSDSQLVQVVVAAGDIHKGDQADALIATKKIVVGNRRRIDLPANVVVRTQDIQGYTATIDMGPGEIITTTKFVGDNTANGSSKSNNLDKGNVAITVTVDDARGVAGLIQPGDFVNVMVDVTAKQVQSPDGKVVNISDEDKPPGDKYLFQKVKVLAVGSNLGTASAAPAPDATATTAPPVTSNLVTFEVPPEAALYIGMATQKNVRLSLVRPDYQPHPVSGPGGGFLALDGDLPGDQGRTPYDGQPATAAPTPGTSR